MRFNYGDRVYFANEFLKHQGFVNEKIPLWDKTLTNDKRKTLHMLGIKEDCE